MRSVRTLFNSFRTSKAAQPEENQNLAFVERIVNGPFSELRHRLSRFQKLSLGLLVSAGSAAVAWGAFSLMAHHYVLDASISQLQIPQSVYGVLDAVSPGQPEVTWKGSLAEVQSPFEGMSSTMLEMVRWLGIALPIMMGFMGVYMVMAHGSFTGLIGAIVMGAALNVLPALLGESANPGHSPQNISRKVDDLRAAVKDGKFSEIRTTMETPGISPDDRLLVLAQLDLAIRNTGTLAQKAAAGSLRKVERLPMGDGQWAYAMEMAADGHVATKAGTTYIRETQESRRAWLNASHIARSATLAMVFACLVVGALWSILRRRVARISGMLELLA